jgi:hypothetical protein
MKISSATRSKNLSAVTIALSVVELTEPNIDEYRKEKAIYSESKTYWSL